MVEFVIRYHEILFNIQIFKHVLLERKNNYVLSFVF